MGGPAGGEDPDLDAPGILLRPGAQLSCVPAFLGGGDAWRHADVLCHLNLAFNALGSLEGLGALPNLQVLDVSHNRLTSVGGVEACPNLRCLLAHGNRLGAWRGDAA